MNRLAHLLLVAVVPALCAMQHARRPQAKSSPVNSSPRIPPAAQTSGSAPALGNDIAEVVESLVRSGVAKGKGEYETTAEYEARKHSIMARYGQLAFVLPAHLSEFEYNADKREMAVHVLSHPEPLSGAEDGVRGAEAFCLRSDLVRSGSYLATNAYGVSRRVRSSVFSERGVAISPYSPISWDRVTRSGTFAFALDVEQARSLKPFLRLVLVGKLARARVYETEAHTFPEIDAPEDATREGLYIELLLANIEVIDVRSGARVTTIGPQAATTPESSGSDGIATKSKREDTGGDVLAPVPVFRVDPEYSDEARKAKFQGSVVLSVEVDDSGRPVSSRVVRSLGLGLDEKAIEAVQKWRFRPAMKDGKPVPGRTTVELTFRLL